jgi:hypothetical protein
VTIDQDSSLYPDLAAGSASANITPFRIYTSPSFVCGTTINFSLEITYNSTTKRTNAFTLKSGFTGIVPTFFNKVESVVIPDADSAGINSSLVISNYSGNIAKLTVSIYATHDRDFDLSFYLIAPDGTTVPLVQNAPTLDPNFGTNCSPLSARTTFDDSAAVSINSGTGPFVGTFKPQGQLSNFSGMDPIGTW